MDLMDLALCIIAGFGIGGFTTLLAGGFEATPDLSKHHQVDPDSQET